MNILHDLLANPDVQSALGTVLLALSGLIATVLSSAGLAFIKSKTSADTFEQLQLFAQYAVLAAEQGKLAGYISDKKASATNLVNAYLKQAGITGVTAEAIDGAIEAAVLRSFNAYKTQPAPAFPFPFGPLPTPDDVDGEPDSGDTPQPEEANG